LPPTGVLAIGSATGFGMTFKMNQNCRQRGRPRHRRR
jgi:hypothetical protein